MRSRLGIAAAAALLVCSSIAALGSVSLFASFFAAGRLAESVPGWFVWTSIVAGVGLGIATDVLLFVVGPLMVRLLGAVGLVSTVSAVVLVVATAGRIGLDSWNALLPLVTDVAPLVQMAVAVVALTAAASVLRTRHEADPRGQAA